MSVLQSLLGLFHRAKGRNVLITKPKKWKYWSNRRKTYFYITNYEETTRMSRCSTNASNMCCVNGCTSRFTRRPDERSLILVSKIQCKYAILSENGVQVRIQNFTLGVYVLKLDKTFWKMQITKSAPPPHTQYCWWAMCSTNIIVKNTVDATDFDHFGVESMKYG